jgi:hypothetical protein
MKQMKLTASLIVRNEENTLGGCLASICDQVDEIVVVDTGSEDGTMEVAGRYGARLLQFPWMSDFSAPRNFALEACTGDWILYIDADERLAPVAPGTLKAALQPDWVAANVHLRPRPGHTPYRIARLFRRHPDIRFEGTIHETVIPSILLVAEREHLAIGDTNLLIEHLGYEGDLSHKHERNLPLLIEATRTSPGRVYLWHHLAETLLALGRTEEACSAARFGIQAAAYSPSEKSVADAAMLYHLIARTDLEAARDPLSTLNEALSHSPQNHALQLVLGQRHLAFGDAKEALRIADGLLAIDPAKMPVGLLSYNESVFGSLALNLKVAALVRLGKMKEAAMEAAQLLARPGA